MENKTKSVQLLKVILGVVIVVGIAALFIILLMLLGASFAGVKFH